MNRTAQIYPRGLVHLFPLLWLAGCSGSAFAPRKVTAVCFALERRVGHRGSFGGPGRGSATSFQQRPVNRFPVALQRSPCPPPSRAGSDSVPDSAALLLAPAEVSLSAAAWHPAQGPT